MMLSWGSFNFSIDTAAYQDLALKADYPWAKIDRLENHPHMQATGKEHRSVTLSGTIHTTYRSGKDQLETLRALASEMAPRALVAGDGKFLGFYVVTKIEETGSLFFKDGVPRKQTFTLEMERYVK